MKGFCFLNNDNKTKDYIKLTVDALKQNKNLITVDNQIQAKELQIHCSRSDDWDKEKLMYDWITKNAEAFRIYLNTIKIISLVLICENKDADMIDRCELEALCEKINSNNKLLENIYV